MPGAVSLAKRLEKSKATRGVMSETKKYNMITHHKVDGYENFLKLMRILDCKGNVILYFHGSSNPAGESWSSACNTSGPVILEVLKQSEAKNSHFVSVGIGNHQDWTDPNCPFRTDDRILLKKLPTLLLWRSTKQLSGKNCADPHKVKLMIDNLP